MDNIITPIIIVSGCFIGFIALAAILNGCNEPQTAKSDQGDYRYVMIEEQQFNRLIEALEGLNRKENNAETNQ